MYIGGMTPNLTTPIRVIGYVRVSTNKQDVSPAVQRADLEREALAKGWELEVRIEPAASAKSMDNRPVLQQALKDLAKKNRDYDALAVSKLDRLSRDVADGALILKVANRQGWALICLDLGVDTSTDTGTTMAQMHLTFAELERKKIAQRTRDGMQKIKASTGKHMGRSSVLEESTRELIHTLRQDGKGYTAIVRELDARGIKTARGGKWYPSTIKAVLESVTSSRTESM